jgi:hypothetical protein
MAGRDVWLTIAGTLASVWLADIFTGHAGAWVAGGIGIVIFVVLSLRREVSEPVRITPTSRESFETETARLNLIQAQQCKKKQEREDGIARILKAIAEMNHRARQGETGLSYHDIPLLKGEEEEWREEAMRRFHSPKR